MDDKISADASAYYETYPEFKEKILELLALKDFDTVIELALEHQPKFLSLAHIILANAYIYRATQNPKSVNKDDAIQSFIHVHLASKYAPHCVDLFLENDVDKPENRFCTRVANKFIADNMQQFNIILSKNETESILKAIEKFYNDHPVPEKNGCGW